jgi:hypothetical protein
VGLGILLLFSRLADPSPPFKVLIMGTEFLHWRALWKAALKNMPAMALVPEKTYTWKSMDEKTTFMSRQPAYRRGPATALRICLGYHVYNKRGRSNAQCAVYIAIQRGAQPRGAHRQRLLRALAGPHGATLARARLIQLGQADRFRHWPKTGQ